MRAGLRGTVGLRVLKNVFVPYFGFPSFWLNDCAGLEESRALTKPVFFYILYILTELVGAWLYTHYVRRFVVRRTKFGEYNHGVLIYHTLYAMAEVPINMLLEFFFHERLTSSDGIFDNKMVGLNNVITLIFVTTLLFVSFDFFMAQIISEDGYSDQDGKLELHELLTIFCSLSLITASIIRIVVNSVEKTPFSKTNSVYTNSTLNVTMSNNTCNEVRWEHFSEFVPTDWAYRNFKLILVKYLNFHLKNTF